MQFMVNVIDDGTHPGTDEEQAAITAFNEELRAEGHWVFAIGLEPPTKAKVVDNRAGKGMVVDGPFLETKEHFVGLWMMEAPDLDAALALARRASLACNRKVELRQTH